MKVLEMIDILSQVLDDYGDKELLVDGSRTVNRIERTYEGEISIATMPGCTLGIRKTRLSRMDRDKILLTTLVHGGVDNWDGWENALDCADSAIRVHEAKL